MDTRTGQNLRRQHSASVLVMTLILGGILTTSLVSYLLWAAAQNRLVAQSQAWNTSIVLAEAGIEDALAQVNVAFGTNYFNSVRKNWEPTDGVYVRSNSLEAGSYSVIISNDFPPTIYSTGYATSPFNQNPIARTVKITTTRAYVFDKAVAALQNVNLNGNSVMVDSYDSSNPAFSTNGQYDPAKRKAGGDVASTDGLLSVGTADIYGRAYTAPWGSVSLGGSVGSLNLSGSGSGMIGDLPANWPQQSGIEAGWWHNDYNANFPDVVIPFNVTIASYIRQNSPSNPGYQTNSWTLQTENYVVYGDFTIGNKQGLLVNGNANLYVTGNFNMSQNNALITLTPGASLTLYVGSTDTSKAVSAGFSTVNQMGTLANASNFQVYGLPSLTSVNFVGNSSLLGTFYAPEANVSLQGSGSTTTNDFRGALVGRSLTLGGQFNIHYDEQLKHTGPVSAFVASSWQEL